MKNQKLKIGDKVTINQGEKFESYTGIILSLNNKTATVRNLANDVWIENIENIEHF